MTEPQPAEVQEGASDPHAPTSTAEDRKAAAALSTLDAQEEGGAKKEVDGKALDKALKGLSVEDKKREEDKKKAVRIEASDVALVMSELELTKPKATELLRANDGNAVKTLTAFVTARP